jgi:branched-chain amino acid transport system ATP-binding protein
MKIADRHVVVEKGRVMWTGTSAELGADATVRQRYLQV